QVQQGDNVIVVMTVDPAQGTKMETVRQEAERKIKSLNQNGKVSVILTAEKPMQPAKVDPHGMEKNPPVKVPAKNIIVVASGKGGVGKSTVSVNLAAKLSDNGLKVGLLDADIYGPSQPLMVGDQTYKAELNEQKKLKPLERYGMKIMSMGFLVEPEKAVVWRGPMVQTAFYQMLRDVAWATEEQPLDYLIIDLPPGTGDVQLTLAQKVSTTGAVIVSTPQDIALIDARRAVEMFKKTNVPVLGLVENMSTHVCSNCGHEEHIFGHGGAEAEAEKLGIPYLGALPLSKKVRLKSDEGTPIVLSDRESEEAAAFSNIVEKLIAAPA
ncbi:MAG: P-loop NTPase, partial [Alphaproteobacteria bacterium]|nr:P-loop NTPase [Alphaproteobacteria bacterium]